MDFVAAAMFTASPTATSPTGDASQTVSTNPRDAATAMTTPGTMTPQLPSGLCVFSGGTAANSLVDAFNEVVSHITSRQQLKRRRADHCPLTYIIPISDNGGSSSELIRFFGGPSVGDIRSRLVRLIPASDDEEGAPPSEHTALRALFEHRLCASDPGMARSEWLDLVEARHVLWTFVPSATRELVRAVLNTLNLEIVKRTRPSTSVFNFAGASVGNLFLTGARLFSGSFEAAIYLLSLLCGIPGHVAVLPAINSNFTHHISAGLADGSTIAGQVNISHPSAPTALPDAGLVSGAQGAASGVLPEHTHGVTTSTDCSAATTAARTRQRASTAVDFEDATLPGSLPVLRQPQIWFSKEDEEDLPVRIARIWYINPYGHEIRPPANPKALAVLRQAEAIVYSVGSLYTSIIPSLVLRGVGAAIAGSSTTGGAERRKKVLILNSKLDRETGPRHDPMTAVDFVRAIVEACKQSQSDFGPVQDGEFPRYVTHVVYLDRARNGDNDANGEWGDSAAIRVDEDALRSLGVQGVVVRSEGSSGKAAERYDVPALTTALKDVLDGTLGDVS